MGGNEVGTANHRRRHLTCQAGKEGLKKLKKWVPKDEKITRGEGSKPVLFSAV